MGKMKVKMELARQEQWLGDDAVSGMLTMAAMALALMALRLTARVVPVA